MKTDSQLQQDVCTELERDPSVNATWVGVEVRDGIVTLAGNVDSYAEKWGAECAALRVAGVSRLAVAIDVKLPGSSKQGDADIAHPDVERRGAASRIRCLWASPASVI